MDKQILQALITTWNPHFTDVAKGKWEQPGIVKREKYLKRLQPLMEIPHVVILSGVRRAGKSTLMQQTMRYLIKEKGVEAKNVLYLFLEDILVQQYLSMGWHLLDEFYNYYLETYNPQGKVYLFLDEIQGIKEFNRWVASRYERKEPIRFIFSGSRKALLESESATVLTGRNVVVNVYPLNFYEYLLIKNVSIAGEDSIQSLIDANFDQQHMLLHHLGNYLYEGGYPEIVLAEGEEAKRAIAGGYYSDIVTRDVLRPNAIRNPQEIELLGLQILADFTKTHTYSSLGRPQNLSVDTVKNYLDYFAKAHLLFESTHFSYKTKKSQDIQRPRKIYVVDNGLRNFNVPQLRPDLGQCAENTAYMELQKNNITVHYWKGKKEIDFVTINPTISFYNVSYTDQPNTRETESMAEGLKEFDKKQGTILTKNYASKTQIDGCTIEFIPLWAWLIRNGRVFFGESNPMK